MTLKCDACDDINETCVVQHSMFKHGFVMTYEGNYVLRKFVKESEIMCDSVDWLHVHSSGECIKTMEVLEPELYLRYVKEFSVAT